ncbi:nuclear transport factor 2 family protein [Deinococcus sp.]|uniref:nuclear transport factor 2 family protein n=1 Tax=Deinococcus sp. TaxID=47478 RepID=UPI003B58F5D6
MSDARSEAALSEIVALDDAWNQGYQDKDVAGLSRVLADDWLGFGAGELTIERAALLSGVPNNPDAALTFARQAIRLYGDTAVTRGSLTANGVYLQSFLRVYAHRAGSWQAVAVQVVP